MVSEKVASRIIWAIIVVLCVAAGRLASLLINGWNMQ